MKHLASNKSVLWILFLALSLVSSSVYGWGGLTHISQAEHFIRLAKTRDSSVPRQIAEIIARDTLTEMAFRTGALDGDLFNFIVRVGGSSDGVSDVPQFARDPNNLMQLTHSGNSAAIAKALLDLARGDVEKAYAYGWVFIHMPGDIVGHGGWVADRSGGTWDNDQSSITALAGLGVNGRHISAEVCADKFSLEKYGLRRAIDSQGYAHILLDLDLNIGLPALFLQKALTKAYGADVTPSYTELANAGALAQVALWLQVTNRAEYENSACTSIPALSTAYNTTLARASSWMSSTSSPASDNFNLDTGVAQAPPPTRPPVNTTSPGGGHPDDTFDISTTLPSGMITQDDWLRGAIQKGNKSALFIWQLSRKIDEYRTLTNEAAKEQKKQEIIELYKANVHFPEFPKAFQEGNPELTQDMVSGEDLAILQNGYPEEAAKLLAGFKEPAARFTFTRTLESLKNHKALVIPSGGLYGYENSVIFKATLNEYVKQGGTLFVLSQKHGYDLASIPTPDGRPLTGYGWEEDQNCFADSVAIETWHQILSGQSRSTPTLNVDGYFTGYPASSTVLLRRTANGQPALLMYEHGLGRVIVTSMYSDWAYGHGQASQEEIALIRDLLAWAKKSAALPEVKPGESITVPVTLTNSTATDAASVKLQIWNPARSNLLSEQSLTMAVSAGQPVTTDVAWQVPANAALGIYHIDYILLDAAGNVIQPQAETDSGRFVVSNPPQVGTVNKDIWLSITSPNQEVFLNEPFVYTFHIFNTTTTTRNLTLKTLLPHTNRTHEWLVTATANGETVISGSDLFIDSRWMFETLRAYLYDESGAQIGSYMLSFKGVYPKVGVTTAAGKGTYRKGETVALSVNLKNSRNAASTVKVGVMVTDPFNSLVYNTSQDLTLDANGSAVLPFTFPLAANAQGGVYTVATEVMDSGNAKIGGDNASFELPLSRIAVNPVMPAALVAGNNLISFNLNNDGNTSIASGIIDLTVKDPDGLPVAAVSQPFTLDPAQAKSVDVSATVPPLKFGVYALVYSQNDETRIGKTTTVALANSATLSGGFDHASYRIRETANLMLNLVNSGRFNLENLTVSVTVPDAGFTETRTFAIGQGQSQLQQYALQLPDTLAAGQHTATVTLTLPGGSLLSKEFTLSVPQSQLSLALSQTGYTAGAVISPVFSNSGGVDTTVQYRLSLYDAKSAMIGDKSATETIQANGSLSPGLSIPVGATDGGYMLVATYSDQKTGKSEIVQKLLTITGVKGALTLKTDKPSYLNTETIAGLSTVSNLGVQLQDGNLHLQVMTAAGSQKQKVWTSQFDFQQGVRNGVDTYGVNDWLIPDDDFESVIDSSKWSVWGPAKVQNGKLFVDSTVTAAGATSKWLFNSDFDVQVDFDNNISTGAEGAGMAVGNGNFWFYVKNTIGNGQESGVTINGSWAGWKAIGGYQQASKLRIVRSGSTIIGYSWTGTGWNQLLSSSNSLFTGNSIVQLDVWRGQGTPAKSNFDNFKVNSGRIASAQEIVDSVQLLPFNDNFDNGSVNSDRWSTVGEVKEQDGKIIIDSSSVESSATHKPMLNGDFDIQVDFSANNSVQGQGAQFDIYNGSVLVFIKNTQLEGYISGIWVNGDYKSWNKTGTYATSGRFRITRSSSTVVTYYWSGTSWVEVHRGTYPELSQPIPARLFVWRGAGYLGANAAFDGFKVSTGKYSTSGTLCLKQDAGRTTTWQNLTWNSTVPLNTSLQLRTRTAATEADLATAAWSDYLTASGSPVSSPPGRWIEVEAALETSDTNISPLLHDVTLTYGNNPGDILWQADVPVNMAQGALADLNNVIGTIGTAGKYYLQGTVTSGTGQAVASAEYPFFVAQGNTLLSFTSDKRLYRPGETVTITGEVRNLAAVEAANFALSLKSNASDGTEQTLFTNSYTLAAGASQSFSTTAVAGSGGKTVITAAITQNGSTLSEISDQFEVATPMVTAAVTAADTVGDDPFTVALSLTNSGKIDASVTVVPSMISQPETVSIPAGQTKLLQYSRQISADTIDSFTISGDLTQVVSKSVKYGPGVTLATTPQAIYAEGKVALPVTVANSGLVDNRLTIDYQLQQGVNRINQQTKSYFLPKGANETDTLLFDLTEGSYQLMAASQRPAATSSGGFQVRKETKAELSLTVGAQSGSLLPATVNVANLGFNPIEGSVRVSLIADSGATPWTAVQEVTLPQSLVTAPQSVSFNVNLSALKPGSYTVKAELTNAVNQVLAAQASPFAISGPTFAIIQLPPYQTIPSGGSGDFTFKVKNSGNQEGRFDLSFKADDLVDALRSDWLKPGEEKEITFALQAVADLDEKDYTAAYTLKNGNSIVAAGVVPYRLAGMKLDVSASLDRQSYSAGDTAQLTLTITRQDSNAAPNLFARVNYNGYNEKQAFLLNNNQTLTFDVPLAQITGEKLFYGIYAESGRSIHLNTLYIHKADTELSVATDKQVYYPGETVTAAISGTATGDLTLSGPGDFAATFAYSGSDSRSFMLPATMTAGTYTVAYNLTDASGRSIGGSTPFDVAGIQVKVKEAQLDKAKYLAADTMQLALTIESNRDLASTIRTWMVDPSGSYMEAGSGDVTLSAATPVVVTRNSALAATTIGIHKLVYGIYHGDLLLASGAKAFDIGEAVLLGLSTDKADYPDVTMPVTVRTELYGTVTAGIEHFLDGASINNGTITPSGLESYSFTIPAAGITPGIHTLKVVLTVGGLTSSREIRFTYGSNLPDLAARIIAQPPAGGTVTVSVTVANQGKSVAGASKAALYDGDPANGGLLLATLDVPAIAAGSSANIPYTWGVLGKGGSHTLYALADSDNRVAEFIEGNNRSLTSLALPSLSLGLSTDQPGYPANADIGISVSAANLTESLAYDALVLKLQVVGPGGLAVNLSEQTVASLPPATANTVTAQWNTGVNTPGSYMIKAGLYSGTELLAVGSVSYAINRTISVTGGITAAPVEVRQGQAITINYSIANVGNSMLNGILRGTLVDPATQLAVAATQLAVATPVAGGETGSFSIAADHLSVQTYSLILEYQDYGQRKTLAGTTLTVRDGIPPALVLISPVQGAIYPAAIPLSLTASDNSSGVYGVEYRLDGGVWSPLQTVDQGTGLFSSLWETSVSDNGSHLIEFRGTDLEGNTGIPVATAFTVQRDVTLPLLQISTLPDRASTNNVTLNVAGMVKDMESGVGGLRINGTPIAIAADGSFSYAVTLNIGENIVTTDAADLAGNHAIDTRTILLDQTAPRLAVSAPADNGVTGRPFVELTGTVDEDALVSVSCGDFAQDAVMNGLEFTASVPLTSGINTVMVSAVDHAGNQTAVKRTVLFDNGKPTLAVTEPPQDLTTNASNLMIKGAVNDQFSAVTVTVTMDGQQYLPLLADGLFEQQLSFPTEKLYQVEVTATDEAGNSVSAQRNIIYDATGPLLIVSPVTSPTALTEQTVTGTREEGNPVTVASSTASVGSVEYPTPTTWQVKLTGLQIGNNPATVSSTDAAGNRSTVTVVITRIASEVRLSVSVKPKILWPPNRKLVPVKVKAKVMSSGTDIESLRIFITDEYGKYNYDHLKSGSTVYLEAWRRGDDHDGRVYTVTAVATDAAGNRFSGETKILVPHEREQTSEHEDHDCD